jgi:acetyl-CoA carboxylase biotin carboxyl carrier protein
MDLKKLKSIIRLMDKMDVVELELQDSEGRVRIVRGRSEYTLRNHIPETEQKVTPAEEKAEELHLITSPFVGVFYRAPSPGSDPFVKPGDRVKKGQTLCIIEAMKLMNEIESDVDGTVTEIVAQEGQTVQYGDTLMKIQTD